MRIKRSDLMGQNHRQQYPESSIFLKNRIWPWGINLKAVHSSREYFVQNAKCLSLYMCADNEYVQRKEL
jgi:hypothetical protein